MRMKRLMLNKKHRLRTFIIVLLFIIMLPVLSVYLSNQLLHKIVTPLYKRLEPVPTDVVEVYEVGPLFYYELYVDKTEVFLNLYPLNNDGLIACMLSGEDVSAIINGIYKNLRVTVKENKINGVTMPFVKSKRDRVEYLNKCIKDITSIIDKESRLSTVMINTENRQEEVLEGIKDIKGILNGINIENNMLNEIKEFVRLQENAMDNVEMSVMLNDGKSFYIIQNAIYQSLNIYSKLLLRLEEIELYNF